MEANEGNLKTLAFLLQQTVAQDPVARKNGSILHIYALTRAL
jgi:hypothetical protein